MEPVIIKKSTESEDDLMIGYLIIIIIPIIWAIYGIVHPLGNFDIWFFSCFIAALLIFPMESFLVSRLPLAPSLILSNEGLTILRNHKRYGRLAIVRRFFPIQKQLIPWNDIEDFVLKTRYEERPSGNEGGTYTLRTDILFIDGAPGKSFDYYSVAALDRRPEEILVLCKQFHKAHKSLGNRR